MGVVEGSCPKLSGMLTRPREEAEVGGAQLAVLDRDDERHLDHILLEVRLVDRVEQPSEWTRRSRCER